MTCGPWDRLDPEIQMKLWSAEIIEVCGEWTRLKLNKPQATLLTGPYFLTSGFDKVGKPRPQRVGHFAARSREDSRGRERPKGGSVRTRESDSPVRVSEKNNPLQQSAMHQ